MKEGMFQIITRDCLSYLKPRESFMFSRNKLLDISEVTVKIEVQSLELIFSVLQLVWGLVWFIATMLFQAL